MAQATPKDLDEHHPIQVVARYTGLSSDLIRTWEKRYQVVQSARSPSGRRLYSNADIQHLSLLRQVTQFGRRISEVAQLPVSELTEIIKRDKDAVAQRSNRGKVRLSTGSIMELFDQCFAAVVKLDNYHLQATLDKALQELGVVFLIEDLISPLLHHIADECRQGELLNCQRRLFLETLRGHLTTLCTQNEAVRDNFVVGSMEEDPTLTALRTAVIGASCSWNSIYLGECVTCDEISEAVASSNASAAIISFDDSSEDIRIPNEMRRLVSLLPNSARLIVSAPDTYAYSSVLNETEASHIHSAGELRLELERLADGIERGEN